NRPRTQVLRSRQRRYGPGTGPGRGAAPGRAPQKSRPIPPAGAPPHRKRSTIDGRRTDANLPENMPSVFRIGDLVLDTGRQQVTRGGTSIHLGPLSYRFLLALAEAAPDVVSHDALAATVWSGRVV